MKYFSTITIIALSIIAGSAVIAQARRGPPPEAIEACKTSREGAACTFQAPGHQVDGICISPPQDTALACAPEGGRGPGGNDNGSRPPQKNNRGNEVSRNEYTGEAPRANMPRRTRKHTTTQTNAGLTTIPANTAPITDSYFSSSTDSTQRNISANGISLHMTGEFPNTGNPNTISAQNYQYSVPLQPSENPLGITQVWGYNFGIGVNGVPFDPGAAEWYLGERNSAWQYAALSGAVILGLDANHAHVQPTGAYHYHGTPVGLLENQDITPQSHSSIIGWAADGFPIYAMYGYADSENSQAAIIELKSAYQLKTGSRPSGTAQPGGTYDGAFVSDYAYLAGQGGLDECNGRFALTPDYPDGTYAYFLTKQWPVIPRCFKGTPDQSFNKHPR